MGLQIRVISVESNIRIWINQFSQESHCLPVLKDPKEARKLNFLAENLIINFKGILLLFSKGNAPNNELIRQNSQTPKIRGVIVLKTLYYLWSHIMRGSNNCIGPTILADHHFGGVKIVKNWIPSFWDYDIFWFDVSVYDPLGVEMLQGEHHAADVELGLLVVEDLYLPDNIEKAHSEDEFPDKQKVLIILLELNELCYEREIVLVVYGSLGVNLFLIWGSYLVFEDEVKNHELLSPLVEA